MYIFDWYFKNTIKWLLKRRARTHNLVRVKVALRPINAIRLYMDE